LDDLNSWKELARANRGITLQLATFLASLREREIPAHTEAILAKAVVDAIGCGLYGLTTEWGRILHAFAAEQGGPAEAGLWASGERVSVPHAVLAAATAIHSFDFDDHSRAKIHPGAIVVPVALALGEKVGADGALVLRAVAAGYETMNRVSQAANPSRARMRGWHLTGTCGTFAAAATASVLLGLDAETTASALGLAGTQSAGLWAFTSDGSMSKRMHPGKAAQDGVTAALLAQRGFVGPRHILEAEDGGFLFAMSDTPRPQRIVEGLGTVWHSDFTCFKPYAACGSNHACIDAVLGLFRDHQLAVSDVERVVAGIPRVVETQTGFPYQADSVLNAQMSLRYNIAVAMYDGQAYLEQFTAERIVEPKVVALARRVEVEVHEDVDRAYPEIYGGRVSLVLKNGETVSRHVEYSCGMPENPMGEEEVRRKFMSLASAAVGAESAGRIREEAGRVFAARSMKPLNELLANCTVPGLRTA
jgi:2-methylcitrate dehydratase PrpD